MIEIAGSGERWTATGARCDCALEITRNPQRAQGNAQAFCNSLFAQRLLARHGIAAASTGGTHAMRGRRVTDPDPRFELRKKTGPPEAALRVPADERRRYCSPSTDTVMVTNTSGCRLRLTE